MLFYQDINSDADKDANKTVTMIHGLGANSDMWKYQFDAFTAAGYRIIAPDLPGFGKSEYHGDEQNAKTMADAVLTTLRQAGVERTHIIGLSMGGAVAQRFTLDYPEFVEKLVLANTAAHFLSRKGGWFYFGPRYALFPISPRKIRSWIIANYVFKNPEHKQYRQEFYEQLLTGNYHAYIKSGLAMAKFDVREELKNIKAPTLVIGGKNDPTTPVYLQEYLRDNINGAQLTVFDCNHVSAVEVHEEFNKEVLDFLNLP